MEDRIKSEITIGYKATNSKGEVTIDLKPTTLTVYDQSPESASFHLVGIIQGIMSPAVKQVKE